MVDLTRKQLKQQAHHLSPIIMIGQHGLTPAVQLEIERALLAHELVKIKMNLDDRDLRKAIIDEICQAREAELIQSIGKVVVIYRKNEENA